MRALSLLLLSSFFSSYNSAAQDCNPSSCKLPNCLCASTSPPGGLSKSNVPMFMTLTIDDAVTQDNFPVINRVLDSNSGGLKNPNGCPIAATFFVCNVYNDYALTEQIYNQGNEIAAHTMNHFVGDPSVDEIRGNQMSLSAFSGVPMNEIIGFRAPFLNHSANSFKRVRGLGSFLYDSTITQPPGSGAYWPYTLDYGPPNDDCRPSVCSEKIRLPGLWEIPLTIMNNLDGSINYAIDPNPIPATNATNGTVPTRQQVVDMWKANFNTAYNGNKQPIGIYLHALWIINDLENRVAALREFIQWTLERGDVYWVTNQQLLAWMMNPTDVAGSKSNPALGCKNTPTTSTCDGGRNTQNPPDTCTWNDANVVGGYYTLKTCFGCPSRPPNITSPGYVPPRAKDRKLIPDDGCSGTDFWDPIAGKCVAVTRSPTAAVAANRKFSKLSVIEDWIGGSNFADLPGGKKSSAGQKIPPSLLILLIFFI